MAGKEMLHGLRDGELDVHQSAVGEYDDEERELATRVAYRDGPEGSPIDLRALAGSEVQLEIDGQLDGPDAADIIAHNGDATAIPLLPQALEDLLSAVGVAIQQSCDARLERIKDATARPRAPRLETRARHPLGDRSRV